MTPQKFALVALLLSAPALAADECRMRQADSPIDSLAVEISKLADCPSEAEWQLARADEEFNRLFPKRTDITSAMVGGVKLTGTAEQLEIANKLLGKAPPRAWLTAAHGCETVLCALTKVFSSEEAAKRALNTAKRNGYLLSLSQEHNKTERIWSEHDVRIVDDVMRNLPTSFNRIEGFENIFRQSKPDEKETDENEFTSGHARDKSTYYVRTDTYVKRLHYIVYYDSAFDPPENQKEALSRAMSARRSVAHEICHIYEFSAQKRPSSQHLGEDECANGWCEIAGWRSSLVDENTRTWSRDPNAMTMTHYAGTSPREDFAESCSYYLMSGDELKDKNPRKYEFLKKHIFGGLEFLPPPFAPKPWPAFNKLLGRASTCTDFLTDDCLSRYVFSSKEPDRMMETANGWRTTSSPDYFWTKSECLNSRRKSFLERYLPLLKQDSAFCSMGGEHELKERLAGLCKKEFLERVKARSPR